MLNWRHGLAVNFELRHCARVEVRLSPNITKSQ